MSQIDTGPSFQLAKLIKQRAGLNERIREAENRVLEALGLLIKKAGLQEESTAFLSGVLTEAARIPKDSERYRELTELGKKK